MKASQQYVIDKSEENARKRWLFSTLFLFLLYPVTMFAFFALLSIWVDVPESALILSLSETILGLIPSTVLWYFAYRNCGAKVLALSLFFSPAKQITNIAQVITQFSSAWTISFVVIHFAIFLYWFVQSLKIRKVNFIIRERGSLAQKL